MQKLFRCLAFAAALASAGSASAGELTVKIADGRATVIARDVPLRQILAEWARVADARIVNAEKLSGGLLSFELIDVPEKQALDILLRSAAGYVTAPRPNPVAGASLFDRVVILATSRPPASSPVPPPQPFNRPAFPQPQFPQDMVDDQDGEPVDADAVPAPGMMQPGVPFPMPPNVDPADMPQQPPAPITAPRPGMLPQPPQPMPGNPYAPPEGTPGPGQIRPGVFPNSPDVPEDVDPQ